MLIHPPLRKSKHPVAVPAVGEEGPQQRHDGALRDLARRPEREEPDEDPSAGNEHQRGEREQKHLHVLIGPLELDEREGNSSYEARGDVEVVANEAEISKKTINTDVLHDRFHRSAGALATIKAHNLWRDVEIIQGNDSVCTSCKIMSIPATAREIGRAHV